jgi:hypothetical protein
VAAHLHVVLLGEADDGVGVVEEEGGGRGAERAELHFAFGDEDAHLLLDEGGVVGLVAEAARVDAAADEQAAGGSGGFEGVGGGSGFGLRECVKRKGGEGGSGGGLSEELAAGGAGTRERHVSNHCRNCESRTGHRAF